MPVDKRGRILTRRMVSLGEGKPFKDGARLYTKKYVGTLKPMDGDDPIPYSTVYRVGAGDLVRYTGKTRATKLRPVRTLISDK